MKDVFAHLIRKRSCGERPIWLVVSAFRYTVKKVLDGSDGR